MNDRYNIKLIFSISLHIVNCRGKWIPVLNLVHLPVDLVIDNHINKETNNCVQFCVIWQYYWSIIVSRLSNTIRCLFQYFLLFKLQTNCTAVYKIIKNVNKKAIFVAP